MLRIKSSAEKTKKVLFAIGNTSANQQENLKTEFQKPFIIKKNIYYFILKFFEKNWQKSREKIALKFGKREK